MFLKRYDTAAKKSDDDKPFINFITTVTSHDRRNYIDNNSKTYICRFPCISVDITSRVTRSREISVNARILQRATILSEKNLDFSIF